MPKGKRNNGKRKQSNPKPTKDGHSDMVPPPKQHSKKAEQKAAERAAVNAEANAKAKDLKLEIRTTISKHIHKKANTANAAADEKDADEVAIENMRVPVFGTIECLEEEIRDMVNAQGLEAAVKKFKVAKILNHQLCVMWNAELPAVREQYYQVHFHVEYRHLDADGPKETFKPRRNFEQAKKELEVEEKKLKKNKRGKNNKKKIEDRIEVVKAKIAKYEIEEPIVSTGPYKPNGHILDRFGKSFGHCPELADDASAVAVEFKNTALKYEKESDARLVPHLRKAFRGRRPKWDAGDQSVEKGRALVEWAEALGENRVSGIMLFMKRGNAEAEEKEPAPDRVVKASMKKGKDLKDEEMDLNEIARCDDEKAAIIAYLSTDVNRDWARAENQRAVRNDTALNRKYRRPRDDDEDDE